MLILQVVSHNLSYRLKIKHKVSKKSALILWRFLVFLAELGGHLSNDDADNAS